MPQRSTPAQEQPQPDASGPIAASGGARSNPTDSARSSGGLRAAGLGFEFASAIAGFALIGFWIDRHYGTYPTALLICLVLGIVGGLYNLIRAARAAIAAPPASPAATISTSRDPRSTSHESSTHDAPSAD